MWQLGFSFCFVLHFHISIYQSSTKRLGVDIYWFQSLLFTVWHVYMYCIWEGWCNCMGLWWNWKINPVFLSIILHWLITFVCAITVNNAWFANQYLLLQSRNIKRLTAYQTQSTERHLYDLLTNFWLSSMCLLNKACLVEIFAIVWCLF